MNRTIATFAAGLAFLSVALGPATVRGDDGDDALELLGRMFPCSLDYEANGGKGILIWSAQADRETLVLNSRWKEFLTVNQGNFSSRTVEGKASATIKIRDLADNIFGSGTTLKLDCQVAQCISISAVTGEVCSVDSNFRDLGCSQLPVVAAKRKSSDEMYICYAYYVKLVLDTLRSSRP